MKSLFKWISLYLIIPVAIAFFFYWLASKDLRQEANELRRLNILTIRALEEADIVELNRDNEDKIIGIKLLLSGSSQVDVKSSGGLTVKRKDGTIDK